MENLSSYVVRDGNGAADLIATEEKFRQDLQTYVDGRAAVDAKVAGAVSAVFDQYKGAKINLPAVKTLALGKLDADPSNYSELSEALEDYIHDNAVSETNPNGIFLIAKGKGGGCCRIADQAKPEQK
jgi:hypothetical protein